MPLLSSPAAAGVSGSQGRQSSHTNWSVPPDAPFLPRPDVVTGIVARSRPLSLSQPEPLPTSLWTTTEPVLASRVRLCEGPRSGRMRGQAVILSGYAGHNSCWRSWEPRDCMSTRLLLAGGANVGPDRAGRRCVGKNQKNPFQLQPIMTDPQPGFASLTGRQACENGRPDAAAGARSTPPFHPRPEHGRRQELFDQPEGEKGQNRGGCANPGGVATCGFVSRIELKWEV